MVVSAKTTYAANGLADYGSWFTGPNTLTVGLDPTSMAFFKTPGIEAVVFRGHEQNRITALYS